MIKNINLAIFFNDIYELKYCVVKYYPFDALQEGNDVDIFAFDIDEIVRRLSFVASVELLNKYEEYSVKISELDRREKKHIHFDIMEKEKIIFRFDLYGTMPDYNRVLVKDGFFSGLIESAIEEDIIDEGVKSIIRRTEEINDLIMRYIEYIEYYQIRPDKIKHLDYIMEKIGEDKRKEIIFFEKLYFYTAIPIKTKKVKKKQLNMRDISNIVIGRIYRWTKKLWDFMTKKIE